MHDLLDKINNNKNYRNHFTDASVISVQYNATMKELEVEISVTSALPFAVYKDFVKNIQKHTKTKARVTVHTEASSLSVLDMNQYVGYVANTRHLTPIKEANCQFTATDITIMCQDEGHRQDAARYAGDLIEGLKQFGLKCDVITEVMVDEPEKDIVVMPALPKSENIERKSVSRQPRRGGKDYNPVPMDILKDEAHGISIAGQVFEVEVRETRTGNFIVKYFISDGEAAVVITDFAKTEDEILKQGICIRAYGNYIFEPRFEKDYVFKMDRYEEIGDIFKRYDSADSKRVEFHLHTKFSEMDGISDASEYMAQAFEWGHPGMIITDHTAVQSFPKAYGSLKNLRKKYPDHDFKLGYGVEMNMVDEDLKIVTRGHGEPLHQGNYISFDFETTGLSNYYDHLIEFGAVRIEQGKVVDSYQTFIKPPVSISAHIQELTNISDNDVRNAPTIENVMDDILAFIGDYPLVAHNAQFDIDFFQEVLRKLGRAPLENAVIDTLDLARALYDNRRSYRLGAVARLLRISYDEDGAHRADYDAEVLSLVFLEMLRDERLMVLETVNDLQSLSDENAYAKMRGSHVNVIAKNKDGLKRLYQLISHSHTKNLAGNEPRIVRSELAKGRENLLIGAGCTNSELFEIAMNKSQLALENAMVFYDYVEIMPLDYYHPLVYRKVIASDERVREILERIIKTAQNLNKPVLAVGNAHYNHPREKVIRDVYIHSQGIGGSRHPLFMYNEQDRLNFVAPNAHFRSTEEMLHEFAWLGDREAYKYVVENPVAMLEQIEDISPKQNDLFTPKLENSDELLREIVNKNAVARYGEPLPEIVSARIERELNSIIGNGYGVIYYISHLMVKRSLDDGYLVGSRGSVGSSLVATMAEITEVNPLAPHYVCLKCHHSEFFDDGRVSSGFDLEAKTCPECGEVMIGDGQDIPFETFLGFEGDKVPDIDLNFSGDYQEHAHNFTKEIFGDAYVYRAGTISTVAQKTAYGYVKGYQESMNLAESSNAWNTYLSYGAEGVKRTTGQHPGGIIVVPDYMDVHDFTPIQYPANNKESSWFTTHFEFHDIDDNVLKLDILGHVDPTAMKLLEKLTGIDAKTVPMNDPETLSLFNRTEALKVDERNYHEITGGLGLPEFGTPFVRGMLEATKPDKFSDLVRISGLSHGTDVWRTNAEDLIKNGGMTLEDVIGCRDDIMVYLMHAGLPAKLSFDIMESVRKGKGLKDEWIQAMHDNKVPQWYIDSCLKIKYMFPKAHAVAYVMMAVRVAWFKVHQARAYYCSYFSLRVNAHEIETQTASMETIQSRLNNINMRLKDFNTARDVSIKEKNLIDTLEVTLELKSRGYTISPIDLELSQATEYTLDPRDDQAILPPFTVLDGLGVNVAKQIIEARQERMFISKKDLMTRGGISSTTVKKLDELGVTSHLQESNQMSLF
ncbi:PolC-type DNA polymerase III [Erysipelothrix sp. HDW6C]|uniref:PolC-type DNA polymerase III n=1 Tax=Erysipelothrix sp. HDW6C TaxID=2714930 RepID=UPI00140B89F3|nr:PolC-type DNA polymerase III [Erysipelothrix sp. HDW6C]QIK70085.1 PolC-type DNA polymerase III [Erysipelothrix sp. HDW6C]